VSWTRYDVFLSYSRSDSAVVDPFVAALRERGYGVFLDTKSIPVGDPWKRRLGEAIRASRVCILCWSADARLSEYVSFEYSRAEGLGKPVLPWLLDATPLPPMIEIQGVTERDPAKAVFEFLPRLGWRLSLRRRFQALCLLVLLIASGAVLWWTHRPPPPWEFSGRVVDSVTRLPISAVRVEVEGVRFVTYTNDEGFYLMQLPQPKPKHLHLLFVKDGYRAEEPVYVSTDRPWKAYMRLLR
jgi:hypothetical protein